MSPSRRRAIGAVRAFARAHHSCPVVRSRCGRARCAAAGPPGSRRRASARCAAWHRAPLLLGVAVRPVFGALGVTRRRALRGPGAPAGGRGCTETPPAKLSACATCHATAHYPRVVRTAARWGHRALPPLHPQYSYARPTACVPPLRTTTGHGALPAVSNGRVPTSDSRTPIVVASSDVSVG